EGIRSVQLSAVAVDRLGASSEAVSRSLEIDTRIPAITVESPLRAPPRGRVEVIVRSTTPLGGPPAILLGGTSATVTRTPSLEVNGVASAYTGVIAVAPGIGVDLWTGTGDLPIEVLEEIERDVPLVVESRAVNGNVSRIDRVVKLSRIAWQRALPAFYGGSFRGSAAAAVAWSDGLVVPLQAESTSWLPGSFRHADGQFRVFSRPDLVLDGGMSPQGLDARGRTYLEDFAFPARNYAYYDTQTGSVPATGITDFDGGIGSLRRVGERLCYEINTGDCQKPAQHGLTCLSPEGPLVTALVGGGADGGTLAPDSGVVAAAPFADTSFGNAETFETSGNTVLLTHYRDCAGIPTQTAFLVDATTGAGLLTQFQVPGFYQPAPVLPFGDGDFAVWYQQDAVADTFILRPDGSRSTTFFSAEARNRVAGSPSGTIWPERVVAARPDGTLVTVRRLGMETFLEAWSENGTTPATVKLPGVWDRVAESGAQTYAVTSDGRTAILLARWPQNPPMSYLVVVLDAAFRPLYVYRSGMNADLELIADDATSLLYLVDGATQTLTALNR
ncbi:MAG TPA: hypothetical protein VFV33_25210, partial [Gemmatimonadaceae bacterium]|nr:hypothetical protein [Gemmatimonadaceae bacterium]